MQYNLNMFTKWQHLLCMFACTLNCGRNMGATCGLDFSLVPPSMLSVMNTEGFIGVKII